MVTLEQVKLLEAKVAKAIEYVNRVTEENNVLTEENNLFIEENNLLRGKLDACQKQVEELEGVVKSFKVDQGRIEEGIVAALDRLNQFEDVIGQNLISVQALGVSDKPSEILDKPPETADKQPEATIQVSENVPVGVSFSEPPQAAVLEGSVGGMEIFEEQGEGKSPFQDTSGEAASEELDIF
jgi:FtsZ-binding cell division protein ZapB